MSIGNEDALGRHREVESLNDITPHMTFQPQDRKRFEQLRALAPLDAVRAWLDGDFGLGDEPALLAAIRRDPRVAASDDEITDIIFEAIDEGLDAAACLERLASLK